MWSTVHPTVVIMLQSNPEGPVGSSSEGLLVLGFVVDADQVNVMPPAVPAGCTPILPLFNQLVISYTHTHTHTHTHTRDC